MDLAEKLIAQNQREENKKSRGFAPHYGIDETGIPIPKPVNSAYIVARIIGNINIYQLSGEFYVERRRYKQTAQNLIALCGRPRVVLFEDEIGDKDSQHEINEMIWKQTKSVINSEHGLIWERLREVVPQFNKRYIRINNLLVWDKEQAEILVIPEEYL